MKEKELQEDCIMKKVSICFNVLNSNDQSEILLRT